MKLAVLSSPDSWYVRDLQRAAGPHHEVTAVPFTRLNARVFKNETSVFSLNATLSFFDAVLIRSMPPGSLEQVVFRMDALQRLEAAGINVLNPPKSIEVAVDKYLTLAKLQAAGQVAAGAEDPAQPVAEGPRVVPADGADRLAVGRYPSP